MNNYSKFWIRLRQNYWAALAFDVIAILAIFVIIHSWQTRHLLPGDEEAMAPDFTLSSLDQETFQLSDYRDRKTILYFFSPSCGICDASMPNLQKFHVDNGGRELQIFGVALNYSNQGEVAEFTGRHDFLSCQAAAGPASGSR